MPYKRHTGLRSINHLCQQLPSLPLTYSSALCAVAQHRELLGARRRCQLPSEGSCFVLPPTCPTPADAENDPE